MQSILTSPAGKLSAKHAPSRNFSARGCRRHPPAVCPSPCPPSQRLPSSNNLSFSLSPTPLLLTSSPTCAFIGAAGEDFSSESAGRPGRLATVPEHLHLPFLSSSCCLRFTAAGSHISTSKGAWLRICLGGEGVAHKQTAVEKKTKKENMQRQAYTRMHRLTLTQAGVYTQTRKRTTHAHTTVRFYQVSLCLAGMRVRLSEL